MEKYLKLWETGISGRGTVVVEGFTEWWDEHARTVSLPWHPASQGPSLLGPCHDGDSQVLWEFWGQQDVVFCWNSSSSDTLIYKYFLPFCGPFHLTVLIVSLDAQKFLILMKSGLSIIFHCWLHFWWHIQEVAKSLVTKPSCIVFFCEFCSFSFHV